MGAETMIDVPSASDDGWPVFEIWKFDPAAPWFLPPGTNDVVLSE